MAKMTISEYTDPRGAHGLGGVAAEPAPVEQELTFTGTAAASLAFSANTVLVRISSDSICRILFGSGTPVALATSKRFTGDCEYFAVTPGHKISAITST